MMYDKKECKVMRIKLEKEFAELGKKMGVNLDFKNMRYGNDIHFTLRVTKAGENFEKEYKPVDEKVVKATFERYAKMKGLEPTDFKRTFKMRQTIYTIDGIKPRAPKYCVKVTTNRGAKYVMPVADVLRNLG